MYFKNTSYILLITILLTTGFGKVGAQNIKETVDSLATDVVFFTIWSEDDKAIIYWVTSSETNNDYFTVQRSNDGVNFEDLINIDGAGNSRVALYYTVVDTSLSPKIPYPYYRLKIVDYDGKAAYLPALALYFFTDKNLLENGVIANTDSISINKFETRNSKREKKLSAKLADYYFDGGLYQRALPRYISLYKNDIANAELNYKIAICYLYTTKYHQQAITFFEKAIEAGKTDVYFDLGLAYHLDSRFDDAIKAFQKYRNSLTVKEYKNSDVNRYIEISKRAKQMIANPVDVKIENLEENINSPYADYVPVITADESVMIFTSRHEESTGRLLDPNNEYFEDVYISYKKNGAWTKAKKIDTNINTNTHDACIGLSTDGQELFIYRTDEEQLLTGDIYVSSLKGTSWSVPRKLGTNINTNWHESSASMTADRKVLYFSSDRPGGYGGRDIYKAEADPIYEWGPAQNLGPTINTPYDEDEPFIHVNGKTLYFSSQDHNTMGGFDIFKSELGEDGLWSEPENLGYPINHVGDDRFFVISASGERGYYSSDMKGGFGGHDIYVVHMPPKMVDLIVMKGVIRSSETKEPLGATIMMIDNETRKTEGIYRSNSATGQYMLVIPPGRVFEMTILVKGYKPDHSNFVLEGEDSYKEIVKDYELKPWQSGTHNEQ